jgi:hypothetical protein
VGRKATDLNPKETDTVAGLPGGSATPGLITHGLRIKPGGADMNSKKTSKVHFPLSKVLIPPSCLLVLFGFSTISLAQQNDRTWN